MYPLADNAHTVWPVPAISKWRDTLDTVHLETQVVGKVRMALEPMTNHWWQVALHVSERGPHDIAHTCR